MAAKKTGAYCLVYYSKGLEVRTHCDAKSMKICMCQYTDQGQGKNKHII